MKKRFQLTTFSAIILRDNNKILLMKRPDNALSGGFYAFPGGAIDGAESITAATIREAQEELGIKLNANDLKFVHILHVKTELGQEYLNFFFEVSKWQNKPLIMEPLKCDKLIWFTINDLPKSIMPTHHHVIKMINQNIAFSEFGWL